MDESSLFLIITLKSMPESINSGSSSPYFKHVETMVEVPVPHCSIIFARYNNRALFLLFGRDKCSRLSDSTLTPGGNVPRLPKLVRECNRVNVLLCAG